MVKSRRWARANHTAPLPDPVTTLAVALTEIALHHAETALEPELLPEHDREAELLATHIIQEIGAQDADREVRCHIGQETEHHPGISRTGGQGIEQGLHHGRG